MQKDPDKIVRLALAKRVNKFTSQQAAAKSWGISQSAISNMLNGTRSIPSYLARDLGFVQIKVWRRIK